MQSFFLKTHIFKGLKLHFKISYSKICLSACAIHQKYVRIGAKALFLIILQWGIFQCYIQWCILSSPKSEAIPFLKSVLQESCRGLCILCRCSVIIFSVSKILTKVTKRNTSSILIVVCVCVCSMFYLCSHHDCTIYFIKIITPVRLHVFCM